MASPQPLTLDENEKREKDKFMVFSVVSLVLLFSTICMPYQLLLKSRNRLPGNSINTVLLISLDGFRYDYIEMTEKQLGPDAVKNFKRLINTGVRANHSVNAYPTITMPNHETLVTGLYPQHNGVVANNFIDSNYPGVSFIMNNQISLNNDPWLNGWPEPIWVTLQKQGGLAGSLLWPSFDKMVLNDLPFQQISQFTTLNNHPNTYEFTKRIDDVLWWLKNPHFHLNLILAYFNEPDESGHAFGPDSALIPPVIQDLDRLIGKLLDGIKERDIANRVDIIITADHGMSTVYRSKLIGLDDYVDPALYNHTELSTIGLLYPAPGKLEYVYQKLRNAHPHMKVYRRNEVPAYLHFNISNSRMPPLVLIPDPNWKIVHNTTYPYARTAGDHGYVTNFTEMHPLFIASGPSFKQGFKVNETHAVDIYPLMCFLLGIVPRPNNGSLQRISSILKPGIFNELENSLEQTVGIMNLQWILTSHGFVMILFLCFILISKIEKKTQEKETPNILHCV